MPWEEVVGLTIVDELIARTSTGTETRLKAGPVDTATVIRLERPKPPLTWTGGAGAGIFGSSGNTDVNTLQLNGELLVHNKLHRFAVGAQANRAEEDGRDTAQNWTFTAGYDRFLNTRIYLNSSGILTNDRFRDIHLRTALSFGVGWQIADSPRAKIAVEGGIGWVNEEFFTAEDDRYTSARESGRIELFFGGERMVLFHRHDGYFGVTGTDNLFVKMQNGVRLGLVAGFVTTAQANLDYDLSPAPERTNTDRSVTLTFGYRF